MYVRVVLMVAGCVAVTPFQLGSPEAACPSRNSCQQRNASHYPGADWCYCDALCNTYADCCYDSEFRDASKERVDEHSDFGCFPIGQFLSYYMKDKCKEGWADAEVEDLCISGGLYTDPLFLSPATSRTTGFTYRNYYCAICNEDVLDLRIWNVRLTCDLPLDSNFDINNLVFINNSWGVFHGSPEMADFRECHLGPERPQDVSNMTRTCSLSVKTCPEEWQDEVVASLCHSYTAVVYYGIIPYRNPHCALCNNERYADYSCSAGTAFAPSPHVPFAQIFDFSDPSGSNLVGSKAPCSDTQNWDPFFKRCRSIVCPKPNQYYRYGRCEAVGDVNGTANSEPTTAPSSASITVSTPAVTSAITAATTASILTTSAPTTPDTDEETPTTPSTNEKDPATPSTNEKDPATPSKGEETPTTPSTDEEATTMTPAGTSWPDAPPLSTFFPDTNSTTTADGAISTNFTSEFIECYKVALSEGEFVALDNGSVYVPEYSRTYSPGEYNARSSEGDVLVCLPDTSSSRKFSAVLGWLTLAGLGLSCVGLLLHLAAFALMPEVRNLSGRNLASLCLALLSAYITFVVNTLVRPDPAACLTLAALMYYFFVASFTWMSVIAFDVWYTFRLTQRQLRVSSGAQWHRFIAYSLYSWLLPAAATLVLLLVDQLEPRGVPEEFLPRLGRTWCWFSHRKALLVFFAAPMVTIIVVNFALFISTAAIITQTSSTAAAASARGSHHQGHYKMYLRLAVLMGFTWVSGIAAGYLDLEALWYVFVVLNTLQGVFIFLAFTFRTRVWQGVGVAARKLLHRGLSKVTRRPPPPDINAFELSQTPEQTSCSSPNTSLDTC